MPGAVALDAATLFAPLAGYTKLGLAVSGGPDSLALLLLAAEWARAERRPELIVYTVDHGLRSEAAGEAAMVVREATRLGLAARALRWEGDKPASGVQAAARAARYRLMATAMAADGLPILVTAHHLGDQAETVLMRMAHGSGIEGLRGMDALSVVEGCEIYRPLLGVHPATLRAIVEEAGLVAAADPGNIDPAYERVRWRQALPVLESLGLSLDRLGVLARRMGEASAVVAEAVEAAYPQLVTPLSGTRAELPHGTFALLQPAVAVDLLGQVLQVTSGDRTSPALGALEALCVRLRTVQPMKPATLHGCVISSDGASIAVVREGERTSVRKARESERAH